MPQVGTYIKIFVALIVLALLTTGVAYLDLGKFNTIAAFVIAFTKAVLVVLFFMHVKYERKLVFVFAIAGFVWLAILIVLISSDYLTRGWLPAPGEMPPLPF
jgi:cytochrome c oxidase subunit 4